MPRNSIFLTLIPHISRSLGYRPPSQSRMQPGSDSMNKTRHAFLHSDDADTVIVVVSSYTVTLVPRRLYPVGGQGWRLQQLRDLYDAFSVAPGRKEVHSPSPTCTCT